MRLNVVFRLAGGEKIIFRKQFHIKTLTLNFKTMQFVFFFSDKNKI